MIVAEHAPVQTEARADLAKFASIISPSEAVPILQRLLAEAIRERAYIFADLERLRALKSERHWFVSVDGGPYCSACNLPKSNGRHAKRAA